MLFLSILQDVPRTFNDILDYYSVHGIMDDKDESENEPHVDKDYFFIVGFLKYITRQNKYGIFFLIFSIKVLL